MDQLTEPTVKPNLAAAARNPQTAATPTGLSFDPATAFSAIGPWTAQATQATSQLFGHLAETPTLMGLPNPLNALTPGGGQQTTAQATAPEHHVPTRAEYGSTIDKQLDARILANRTTRTTLDKAKKDNAPTAADTQTQLNTDRESLLTDLKERSGVYDADIAAISKQLPDKLPKKLSADQQKLVDERKKLETEKGKFSDQQTALQRWHDRGRINSINEQLQDPKLDAKTKQQLTAEKKKLATGLLSTTKSYQQFDERWGDTIYGKDKSYTTMTEAGCGPTALAMMMDFRDQEDPEGQHSRGVKDPYTPRKMADYATRHGRVKGNGTDGATMMNDLEASFPGFSGNTLNNRTNATTSLRNGIPVMFLGHNITGHGADGENVSPYAGHFMLLNGVSDDGKSYSVHDGGRNNTRNIHNIDSNQLDGQVTNYWNVNHTP